MNRFKRLWNARWAAIVLSWMVPLSSWANLTNTASVSFKDAAGSSYSNNSNTVTVTVTGIQPSITSATTANGDVKVAFSYQITATNSPTSYNATGLPAGLSVNTTTGLISGTPTAAGTFTVTLSATNASGTGTSPLTLTVRAAANITLTKSASPTTAASGDIVTFTLAYKNTANGSASNVLVTDVIPAGSTLVAGSITGGGTESGGTITWNLGTVSGGASGTLTFKVTVQ